MNYNKIFFLINIRKLEYNYCCVAARLISFVFVQENTFASFNLYHCDAG